MHPWSLSGGLLAMNDEGVAIVFFVMAALVTAVYFITKNWRLAQQAAYTARLKQIMIERGMSAAEIERVINCSESPRDAAAAAKRRDRPLEL